MNDPELPDLPADVAALLDDARGVPRAPDADRRRVAARLAVTVGVAIPAASLAGARFAGRAWLLKVVGIAALVAVGGGLAHRASHGPATHARTSRAPITHAPLFVAPQAARVAPETPPTPEPVASPAPLPAVPAIAPTAPAPHASVASARVDEDQAFQAELALLERAMTAFGRDDLAGASSALALHARRFPRGRLAPEREALRVRCLAARGDVPAAEAARRRFHQRYPGSVLGAAVDRSVEGAAAH